jgi:hypothetical protein
MAGMIVMLCRSLVEDFEKWRRVFASHAQAHRDAGLHLKGLWRETGRPNNVFFLFEVADRERAEEFLHKPESAEAGVEAGVIEGEYHFLESGPAY